MKKIQNSSFIKVIVITWLMLNSVLTFGQVTVNLQVNPPYSPFFRDYQGYDISKVLVTLFSTSNRQVYLTATLTSSDGSIQIGVTPNFKPLTPVQLLANQLRTLNGTQLNTIFGQSTKNDLVVTGLSIDEVIYNQAFPEGVYTMCIDVKDYQTGQVLGTSCRSMNIFYYEPPQFIQPICDKSIKETKPQNVMVRWNPVSPGTSNLKYKLKICKQIPNISPLDGLNNNIQVILDRSNLSTTFFQLGDVSGIKLEPGESYWMQVTAYSPNAIFKNNGASDVCSFTYLKDDNLIIIPANEVNEFGLNPYESSVAGKLVYRYKEENDQPKASTFTVAQIVSADLKIKKGSMPSVVGSQLFDNGSGTAPIKNTKIYLVYDLVTTTKSNPTSWKDFKELTKPNGVKPTDNYIELDNDEQIYDNQFVVETTTASDGSFSFPPFENNYKIGYLGNHPVSYKYGIKPLDQYGKQSTYSSPAQNVYGVFHIVIDGTSYYCNPDVMLFPKPGEGVVLQQEVCFVNSRNVEITVRTDPKIQDQIVGQGKVLTGYPVQFGRENHYQKYSSYPIESDEASLTKLTAQSQNNRPLRILSAGKTDKDGKYLVKNICNSHIPLIIQATDPGFDATKVYELKELSYSTDKPSNLEKSVYNPSQSNSQFQPLTEQKTLDLRPKNPEIYIRALAEQNGQTVGIAEATIEITQYWIGFPFKKIYKTDQDGYFHLPNIQPSFDENGKVIGPKLSITLKKYGYKDSLLCNNKVLRLGERFPSNPEVKMSGSSNIYGFIQNEKGEAVICHVRVGSGPLVKNSSFLGYFSIPNCPSGFQKIEIIPDVDNYYGDTLSYYLLPNTTNQIKKIVLKEKLHRVIFKIVDENNKPITGKLCLIDINNGMKMGATSSSTGQTAEIAFASPSQEFHIKTNISGFVPYDDYVKIPNSKFPKTITLILSEGQTIQGYVYDLATNKPISGARVYVVTGTNDDGETQRETKTNSDGKYILSNVPVPGYSFQSFTTYDFFTRKTKKSSAYLSNKLTVFAVKSGNPAYIQSSATYKTKDTKSVDFKLAKINGDATIWGNPVEITKFEHNKIWGSFVNMKGNPNFAPLLSNAKLPFNGILLTQTGLNQGKLVPESNEIETQTSSLKIKIFNDFTGEVVGSTAPRSAVKLKIIGNSADNTGNLDGFVVNTLAGFNFSYSYTGGFLLQLPRIRIPGNSIASEKPFHVLATHSSTSINSSKYDLLPYGSGSFKVHNFNASLGKNSYVQNGTFMLSPDVTLDLPLTNNQKLDVGDIKITKDSIVWMDGNKSVAINLEKWRIEGTGLKYDANKGGFVILNSKLVTHLPTMEMKQVVLRPVGIDMESNPMSNVSLNLGGVTPMRLYSGSGVSLTFDQAAPFDKKSHWRINITNSSGSAAYIESIPGLATDDKIDISLISAYSDGEHQTTSIVPNWHNFFNVMMQKVVGIEIGKGYFTLIGDTDIKIPGAGSSITGRFKYTKENGAVIQSVESLNTDIELPGKVQFNGRQTISDIYLSQDTLRVKGDLYVYQKGKTDGFSVQSTLLKTPYQTSVIMKPGEVISLEKSGVKSNGLKIIYGGDTVVGNSWNNVKMTTQILGFGNIALPGNDILDFVIKGAIENNPASKREVKLDGINTPFGGIKMCFDFDNKIMSGSLTVPSFPPIAVGPVSFSEGTIDMQLGGGGFIFAGTFHNVTFTPITLIGGLQASIAMGYFSGPIPNFIQTNLLKNTLYKELPKGLTTVGLAGMYCNIGKTYSGSFGAGGILPESVAKYLPSLDYAVGFDLRTILNVKGNPTFEISGLAKGNVNGGMNLVGCHVGANASAIGIISMQWNEGLSGEIILEGEIEPELCTPLTKIGLGVKASYANSELNFDFYSK